jgi:hypothetical protein
VGSIPTPGTLESITYSHEAKVIAPPKWCKLSLFCPCREKRMTPELAPSVPVFASQPESRGDLFGYILTAVRESP